MIGYNAPNTNPATGGQVSSNQPIPSASPIATIFVTGPITRNVNNAVTTRLKSGTKIPRITCGNKGLINFSNFAWTNTATTIGMTEQG